MATLADPSNAKIAIVSNGCEGDVDQRPVFDADGLQLARLLGGARRLIGRGVGGRAELSVGFVDRLQQIFKTTATVDWKHPVKALAEYIEIALGEQTDGNNMRMLGHGNSSPKLPASTIFFDARANCYG